MGLCKLETDLFKDFVYIVLLFFFGEVLEWLAKFFDSFDKFRPTDFAVEVQVKRVENHSGVNINRFKTYGPACPPIFQNILSLHNI